MPILWVSLKRSTDMIEMERSELIEELAVGKIGKLLQIFIV